MEVVCNGDMGVEQESLSTLLKLEIISKVREWYSRIEKVNKRHCLGQGY